MRDEDLLVWLLTPQRVITAYRFYGARHAAITQGFKLDFELDGGGIHLPHLKGTLHLGTPWLSDIDRLGCFQSFCRMLWGHLKDNTECEDFYYTLLEELSLRFCKQNPKRAVVEGYLRLLDYEGRLNMTNACFACSGEIKDEQIAIARGFLLSHCSCLPKNSFNAKEILSCFKKKSCVDLSDEIVNELYYIVLEGL